MFKFITILLIVANAYAFLRGFTLLNSQSENNSITSLNESYYVAESSEYTAAINYDDLVEEDDSVLDFIDKELSTQKGFKSFKEKQSRSDIPDIPIYLISEINDSETRSIVEKLTILWLKNVLMTRTFLKTIYSLFNNFENNDMANNVNNSKN
jgi:hypothetical protein